MAERGLQLIGDDHHGQELAPRATGGLGDGQQRRNSVTEVRGIDAGRSRLEIVGVKVAHQRRVGEGGKARVHTLSRAQQRGFGVPRAVQGLSPQDARRFPVYSANATSQRIGHQPRRLRQHSGRDVTGCCAQGEVGHTLGDRRHDTLLVHYSPGHPVAPALLTAGESSMRHG